MSLPTLEDLDDAALVESVLLGTRRAPMVLFDRYARRIERILTRILGPEADVGGHLNDVFCRALDRLAELTDASGLRPWLDTIAVFVAREALRAARRRSWLEFRPWEQLPEVACEMPVDAKEAIAHLYAALGELGPDDRILFVLRYVEQRELADVAAVTGASLATAKRRLARAEGRFHRIAERDPVLRGWIAGRGDS